MTLRPHPLRRTRRLPAAVTALVALAALVPAIRPAAAITVDPVPVSDGFVDAVLAATGGVNVYADDSSSTSCMSNSRAGRVVYATDRLLMRTNLPDAEVLAAVRAALAGIGIAGADVRVHRRIDLPGVTNLPLVALELTGVPGDKIVRLARTLSAAGHRAAPNYFFQPAGGPTYMWPNGRPSAITSLPKARSSSVGAGVRVVIYDTGVPSSAEANLPSNVSRLSTADVEVIDGNGDGFVDRHDSGHATAMAGIIRTLAPGASVQVARIAQASGVTTDLSAALRMAETLRSAETNDTWPDIIVAAFGTVVCDLQENVPGVQLQSMGLEAVVEAIANKGRSVLLASAGNVGTDHPFYPAAFPGVTAVGALDTSADADGNAYTAPSRSGPRAPFSNYGSWVDVWAPGVSLPTYHVRNVRFGADGDLINGMGSVDGTSFSAPAAAAGLADVISRTGATPAAALQALLNAGVRCSAAIGGGTSIALASMTASPLAPPMAGTRPAC